MAQYNKAFGISFNENDGGTGFWSDPEYYDDYIRHVRCLGRIRARLFFMKKFWALLKQIELYSDAPNIWIPKKAHKFKV